ncbi:hypothetical protein PTSG_05614 [Salpingoeca rosetta]|uniref:Fe2OG dioxygenase domain-containing protein n=1 Tax=Salpingoeca rosetta (strain ATCC 50818 / BSB-021) TaxID=946362 RepID=F2UBQ2_SALR5|nr:uncharacterized protein PTSG_05614 [Salpingoeca rosetta]EGD73918.1 hypothetical protein PTSG_05614 [Salpingoeca rosetta]|eukprot:XP_004993481.1 hypothetical protein PTSG_05614 [Salpingoeca rosetta]
MAAQQRRRPGRGARGGKGSAGGNSDMRNKGLLLTAFAGGFIAFVIFIIDSMQHGETTLALEFENITAASWPVPCALPAATRGGNPLCQTSSCARMVWDGLVPMEDVDQLRSTADTIMNKYGGADGGTAQTQHDEYWHTHIDKVTYGSFDYTCLLYLSTYRQNFTGGRFVFEDKSYRGGDMHRVVEPKAGRVSCFTSGAENPHHVEQVASGTRYALTIAFTCDPDMAIPQPRATEATTSSAVPSNL